MICNLCVRYVPLESGGPRPTVHKKYQPHDTIAICNLSKRGISEKVAQLYAAGHSLLYISERLNISRWKARTLLQERETPLRSQVVDPKTKTKKPMDLSPKVAPYGYCLIDGKLVSDPKEQSIIQIIERHWRNGMSHRAITKKLNGQKFRPRRAKTWSQALVSSIIKRLQNPKTQ